LPLASLRGRGNVGGESMAFQRSVFGGRALGANALLVLRATSRIGGKLALLGAFASLISPLRAQQNPTPTPSTNVATQSLTLYPQNPVTPVTQFTATPSFPGNAQGYNYWIVAHNANGDAGAPSGPFGTKVGALASAQYPVQLSFQFPPGVTSVDILRINTFISPPTGACGCAVATGVTIGVFSDTVTNTTAYTVSTSADQLLTTLTNVNAVASPGIAPVATNVIYATNYGLPATGYYSCVANWSNSSQTVTTDATTDVPFTAAMVGWQVFGTDGPCQFANGSATPSATELEGTITGFNNANSIQISVTPSASCAGSQSGHISCRLYWVPADSATALNAAWQAATALRGACYQLVLPAGVYKFNAPIISTGNCGPILGLETGTAYNGPSVTGQSMSSTILVADPLLNAATCTPGCVFGLSSSSTTQSLSITNLTISGGGNGTVTNGNGACKVADAGGGATWYGTLENVFLDYWGQNTAGFTGICWGGTGNGAMAYIKDVTVLNGGNSCGTLTNSVVVDMLQCSTPKGLTVTSGGQVTLIGFSGGAGSGGGPAITISGSGTSCAAGSTSAAPYVDLYDMNVQVGGGTEALQISSPCPTNITDSSLNCASSTYCVGVGSAANAGVVHIKGSWVKQTGTGNLFQPISGTDASSLVADDGGNYFQGPNVLTGLPFQADGRTIQGACTGTATSSSTLGLYGTGPNQTTTTCTSTTIGAGITATRPGTLWNLQVTASNAGVSASSGVVTVLKNGSATTITCTIGTSTSCNDGTHSVAIAAGDLISIEFTTQATETLAGVKASVAWY
jgi:hypothetical protein